MADSESTREEIEASSMEPADEYHELIESIERRMDPGSNTVLVVDDEMGIRRFVARSIRKSARNIVVHEAENGQQALEVLQEIREKYTRDPVFIVTDLNMPVMDGWELIQRLYKEYTAEGKSQGIPIIVLSSTSGEKGHIFKKSVHGTRAKYSPLVSVAKEACTNPSRYTAVGERGLVAWIREFSKYT